MPLILPLLRALWVSSNVYDSFKTLKTPPPSQKNGGQPTVRALSQRKRNIKGCMTVWLVWCCFATYERTLDSFVGIIIPFYTEIKSLLIIFFLMTSARGAEPIYLHVLRPAIKPYAPTLDILMDLVHSLGDMFILLLNVPLEMFGMSISPYDPSPFVPSQTSGIPVVPLEGSSSSPSAEEVNPGDSERVEAEPVSPQGPPGRAASSM